MILDPKNAADWTVYENDGILKNAARFHGKRTNNPNATVLDYQKPLLDEALSFVMKWNTAIDGGAHYGLMSYHLNSLFKKVHSFEIDHNIRNCLKDNVQKFNLDNVAVYDFGLGECEKMVSVLRPKNKSFSTHIDPGKSTGEYLIKSIDSLNLDSLDFIKLDCEGYETYILQGAIESIKKFKPVIMMERKHLSLLWGLDKFAPTRVLEQIGYKEVVSYGKDCIATYQGNI